MPWSPSDAAKRDKSANTPKKRRKWARIANAVLQRTGNEGMAIRVANSKVEWELQRTPLLVESLFRQALEAGFPRQDPRAKDKKKPKKGSLWSRVKQGALKFGAEVGRALDPDPSAEKHRLKALRKS